MVNINLTASMRSNLLSLQTIANQQDLVQNRLATGLKVSSAIDNPSSYYTAQSLSNRAADLTQLLDSMSQGIQTLKAASEAITSATNFLEQATSIAAQAMENPNLKVIAAHVSTEADLRAAIDSGKEGLIVLDQDITITANTSIILKDGQSIVGAKYLDNSKAKTHINFDFNDGSIHDGIVAGNNSFFSDLTINYSTSFGQGHSGAIAAYGKTGINVSNVDFNIKNTDTAYSGFYAVSAVMGVYNAEININDNININHDGFRAIGFFAHQSSTMNFNGKVNSSINDPSSWTFWAHTDSVMNFNSGSETNISTRTTSTTQIGYGILNSAATVNIYGGAKISNFNDVQNANSTFFRNEYGAGDPEYKVGQGIYFYSGALLSSYNSILGTNTESQITSNFILDIKGRFTDLSAYPDKYIDTGPAVKYNSKPEKKEVNKESSQYNGILDQFNSLIKDASYKGVNLLLHQDLKINFNEDRSSKIEIKGVDASSKGLGLNNADWQTQEDILKSMDEIRNALNEIRTYQSQFGNYYSIVSTREDFTNNLINVLTEGADKLTLADMNQESANMLALQTAQSLAVNSLSLASQASQSILKLF